MKLGKLYDEEIILKNSIIKCDCENNNCAGKFSQIKHWQTNCQWECVRLGFATKMDLKHNIFNDMKLTLTIEELTDEETKKTFKGVFGTLTLQKHRDAFAEEMAEFKTKQAEYEAEVEKNEDTPMLSPIQPRLKSINFALNIKSVPNLEGIVNQLMKDAINLERNEKFAVLRAGVKAKNLVKQTFNKVKDKMGFGKEEITYEEQN